MDANQFSDDLQGVMERQGVEQFVVVATGAEVRVVTQDQGTFIQFAIHALFDCLNTEEKLSLLNNLQA